MVVALRTVDAAARRGEWREAWEAGAAPPVVLAATHMAALDVIPLDALQLHAHGD